MHMGPKGTLVDPQDIHVLSLASAHMHVPPSHQTSLVKLKFKDENLRIPKCDRRALNKAGPSGCGSLKEVAHPRSTLGTLSPRAPVGLYPRLSGVCVRFIICRLRED